MNLGERLRLERRTRKLRQKDLARLLGISTCSIKRWEAGAEEPNAYNRLQLSRVLGISGLTSSFSSEGETPAPATTYFVTDHRRELDRLHTQGHLMTRMLGDLLPYQPDPARFKRVLDVACGTGGWLIALALLYPHTEHLVGVDIDPRMLTFAQEQARAAGVAHRLAFREMDALKAFVFPDGVFDLVNLRFGVSFIRTWDWINVLKEMLRVLKPGGTIRLVDVQYIETNMTWLSRYWDHGRRAAVQAGYLDPEDREITGRFPGSLHAAGFQHIHSRVAPATYEQGTPEYALWCENTLDLARKVEGYLRKRTNVDEALREWGLVSYQHLIEVIAGEMEQPGAWVRQPIETVWSVR